MSNEITYGPRRIQRILRRRKAMIVEEEELITENVSEEPIEGFFQEVIMHDVPSVHITTASSETQTEPTIDDLEERKELAKIVGLQSIPLKTNVAFDEIIGIFDNLTNEKEIDAVRMVKALRRRR